MPKVMVVDDEESLLEAIRYALSREGIEVVTAADGGQAMRDFEAERPDLVVLDLMLPTLNGWDVCRRIRATSQVPILMLTARDAEVDRVVGLEMGADDYVTKPFSLRELVARVRALLRRAGTATDGPRPETAVLEVGGIRLDQERHEVSVRGTQVNLPLKEFELLELLMENRNRVLTRQTLIDRVWGSDYVGDTKTLDVHVKRLRAKIEPDPANPKYLVTVRGLGYKLLPSDQARAQIRHDVAVKIFQQHDVKLFGSHDQLHAGVVDNLVVSFNLRKIRGHFSEAVKKETV